MRLLALTCTAIGALAFASPAPAQATGFGLGLAGGYVDIGGGDLSDVKGGFGADFALRFRWSSGFGIGAGTEIAWLGLKGDELLELSDLRLITVFAEPRFNFAARTSRVSPFLGARIAYARLNFNLLEDEIVQANSDGIELGGVGGVEIWLTDGVAVSITGELSGLSFGSVQRAGPVEIERDDLGNGTKFGVVAGIEIAFL